MATEYAIRNTHYALDPPVLIELALLLCRLLGHSGEKRFLEPLAAPLEYPDPLFQDGAAIGLGLIIALVRLKDTGALEEADEMGG